MELFPNLDFEYELASGSRALNSVMQKTIQRWGSVMRLMPDQDAVLPWGYSESARIHAPEAARSWPALEDVKRVNSKVFSHQVETSLGIQLPNATLVHSLDEVRHAAQNLERLLVKAPFGVSGRERMEIRDGTWDAPVEGWLKAKLKVDPLLCEPMVTIHQDYSFQFDVTKKGELVFRGWSLLVTDKRGQHRGHIRTLESPPDWFAQVRAGVEKVAAAGYWGPLGVDAFVGELKGLPVIRPLCEINARMTFGRLALELFDSLDWDQTMYWWHPSDRIRAKHQPAGPVTSTSPAGLYLLANNVDPGGASGSIVGLSQTNEPFPWDPC